MHYDVVTIGDAMRDLFIFPRLEEMERPLSKSQINRRVEGDKFLIFEFGDKIAVDDFQYEIGGTACNVASGLAKLGVDTGIISIIGEDHEGGEVIKRLEENSVSAKNIKKLQSGKTGFSAIVSYKGERSILVYHGFGPEDLEIPENLNTDWLYIGPLGENYRSLYSKITTLAAEKNVKVALNPGSIQINDGLLAFGALLRIIKILFVNKEEACKMAGVSGVIRTEELAKILQKAGPETVVITDGKEGAHVLSPEGYVKVGIFPGARVESTGAGDSFAAAYLAALINGEKPITCLQWGVTNSASVVGQVGAHKGLLTKNIIEEKIHGYHWPADSLRFR